MHETTLSRAKEVRAKADTVINQIPLMTRMACGFRDAVYSDGHRREGEPCDVIVTAKVGRGNLRYVEIRLEQTDVYTVRLLKIPTVRAKDQSIKELDRVEWIYADKLGETVYRMTNR